MYSKEEVIKLCKEAYACRYDDSGIGLMDDIYGCGYNPDAWIEENIK